MANEFRMAGDWISVCESSVIAEDVVIGSNLENVEIRELFLIW